MCLRCCCSTHYLNQAVQQQQAGIKICHLLGMPCMFCGLVDVATSTALTCRGMVRQQQASINDDATGCLACLACRLVDVTTNTGLTPLHYAAWKGRGDTLKQLVNAGAALAVPSASDTMGAVAANAGSTPLHLAAMKVRLVWGGSGGACRRVRGSWLAQAGAVGLTTAGMIQIMHIMRCCTASIVFPAAAAAATGRCGHRAPAAAGQCQAHGSGGS